MNNETSHAGSLLARLSVGTVIVPQSIAPSESTLDADSVLLNAINRQTDLVRLQDRKGLTVYMNTAFVKGYAPDKSVASLSPSESIAQVSTGRTEVAKQQNIDPIAVVIILASCILVGLCLAWPRRHQLLATTSTSFSRVVARTPAEKSTIDLEAEHALDEKARAASKDKSTARVNTSNKEEVS